MQHLQKLFSPLPLLGILAIFASCEQRPIEIDLPEEEEKLTLIGILLDGIPLDVYVGKTQQFNLDTIDYDVDDPLIILFEDGVPIDTLTAFSTPANQRNPQLLFRSQRIMALRASSCYYLTAEVEGLPSIRTEPQCYDPKLQLDTMSINAEIIEEYPENEEGFSPVRVLLRSVTTHIIGSVNPGDIVLLQFFSSTSFSPRTYSNKGADVEVPIPLYANLGALNWTWNNSDEYLTTRGIYVKDRKELVLEITRYPADYEDFFNTIYAQTEEISGLGATNEPAPNNIINGYGYFSIGERYARTFEF
jgi:hypothetical protein